jgi:hypothetical protein
MKVIWKFPIAIKQSPIEIILPVIFKMLTVQKQDQQFMLWAEVEIEMYQEPIQVYVIGTGQVLPPWPVIYIGTVQDGGYVWHFYYRDSNMIRCQKIQQEAKKSQQ